MRRFTLSVDLDERAACALAAFVGVVARGDYASPAQAAARAVELGDAMVVALRQDVPSDTLPMRPEQVKAVRVFDSDADE